MIKEINGDLLDAKEGIICHQTNFFGVMGGGIALAIKEKLLDEQQYKHYQNVCAKSGSLLLCDVLMIPIRPRLEVANCFCQNEYPDAQGCLTNYGAMSMCFKRVKSHAITAGLPILLPGYMGCGIAGGEWGIVKDIIEQSFADLDCTIVYKEGQRFVDESCRIINKEYKG